MPPFRLRLAPILDFNVPQLTNRLRQYRLKSQLTQEEVATRLDKSRTTVSRHESGLQEFTIDDLNCYAEIYGCSAVELVVDLPIMPETAEEIDALTSFRLVSTADKPLALQLLRRMAGGRPSD